VALDPRADVEKLERMMAMYERLKAKEAELAYNAAKGRILKIDEVQIKTILDLIKKAKVGPKFSEIHEGPERRASRFSLGCRSDDRSLGLSQGHKHSRGTYG
jgi:hypothetical protein